MPNRTVVIVGAFALVIAACGGGSNDGSSPHPTAESSVVAWFEAIESGDAQGAAKAVHPETLALIYGIENNVANDTLADYVSHGVPLALQESYWASFKAGFSEFAQKPLSTLIVGVAETFVSNGETFASVPISSGSAGETAVIVRERPDGTWEVDLVATLGDGFSTFLLDKYAELGSSESDTRLRLAYAEVVGPAMWAALADGSLGDDFARSALTLLDRIEENDG
jgi:hypothetical protein